MARKNVMKSVKKSLALALVVILITCTFLFNGAMWNTSAATVTTWDFSPYVDYKQSTTLSSLINTGDFSGYVKSSCNSGGTWIVDKGNLHAAVGGSITIKTAENSPFTAIFSSTGSDIKPTIRVSSSSNGPWTTITPEYTQDTNTGFWTLYVDGIGEGNSYVRYIISGTDLTNYWYHKLRTIVFNSSNQSADEITVSCSDGVSVSDEYAKPGDEVVITVDADVSLKAGSLIVYDGDGQRVLTQRVGFREGGNAEKISFTMPEAAPVTVEVEQYDAATAENANIGSLGVQLRYAADTTKGQYDGIRFGTQFRYDTKNNTKTLTILGKTYTIISYGTLITREAILNKIRGDVAIEDYFTHEGWQDRYSQYLIDIPQTKVYDSCEDYIEFVGGITGLTEKHYYYVFAARGYVEAVANGQRYMFYTDIMTSSVNGFGSDEEVSYISGSPNLDYTGKKVGVLTPVDEVEYYDNVMSAIQSGVNATVDEIAWADAATAISVDNYDVIIIPESGSYPANAADAIDTYLQNGGKLLTLGGPPLQDGETLIDGEWMNQEEAFNSAEKELILDFSNSTDCALSLNADNSSTLGMTIVTETGTVPDGSNAVHVTYQNPQNWAQMGKSASAYLEGANSLSFYLKGNETYYTGLSIGVNVPTGTYYAIVMPTSDWNLVTLAEEDFLLWADGKIHSDEHPDLDTVTKITFGISQTHVPFHMGQMHEFWVSSPVLQTVESLGATDMVLDGIAPEYKFYPITNGVSIEAFQNQSFVATRNYKLPKEMFAATPRPQGTGFGRSKSVRFVPLIEVRDEKDLRSGYMAWMFVNSTGKDSSYDTEYEGSIIASFGTSQATFYNEQGCAAVVDVLRALLNDYMFVEAGATDDLYIDDEAQTLTIGAYTRGNDATGLTIEFDFVKGKNVLFTKSYNLSDLYTKKTNGEINVKNVSFDYSLMYGKPDRVITTIKKDGEVIDTVKQKITFWSPKPEGERKYVSTANNEFIRDGKVVRFYGVSYVPTSCMATEDTQLWEHYLAPNSFDPDVIYNDLLRMKEIGFNSIATYIYYVDAMQLNSLIWLADTCDKLGMCLEVDIRPHADPFDLVESEVVKTFEKLHLAELDNIVSFGVAWERSFGSYDGNYGNLAGRKAYDDYWVQWVEDNYGSIANAEAVWGESMPTTDEGEYTAVSDEALRLETSTKLVAAYRRFADDLVASKHAYVRELFDRLSPNHMITARAGDVGCIPTADAAKMGYDFTALACGMDYLSPEYYSSYDYIEQVIFTNTYSRYSSPDAAVTWKEFKASDKWRGSNFDDPAYASLRTKIDKESVAYYTKFMDNVILGHTSGCYLWFSAGGYRYNERSDCGVINPDGSDRAVTKLVRRYKNKFMNQPALGEADVVITIDRDQYNNSITGIYDAVKDELLTAVKSGKTVAFKDASTGTDTATVSNAAVGGGVASATNPARWVNGVFQSVYVKQSDGSWKQIKSGDAVDSDTTLEIKVVMTNMSACEWLSKSNSETAYVSLVSTENSGISFDIALNDNVEHLETYTQEFTLSESVSSGTVVQFRLGIQGRFMFANPFTFTIN